MSDPTNENAGATPPENPPAGEAPEAPQAAAEEVPTAGEVPTAALPAAEAAPAQDQAAAATAAEQPTATMPAAAATPAGAPPAAPHQAWYRRRWALITGAVVAAAILFFGGMAVGTAIGDHGRGGFAHEGRSFPAAARARPRRAGATTARRHGMMPPGMGQNGQGYGHDRDQDGNGYGQPQAPGTTPAPSTSPQALTQ